MAFGEECTLRACSAGTLGRRGMNFGQDHLLEVQSSGPMGCAMLRKFVVHEQLAALSVVISLVSL
jgi:hypothetical protein